MAAGDEAGIELRLADLDDVDPHPPSGEALQLLPELVDPLAAATDDDAGAGGVDGDGHHVGVAVDLDAGDAGVGQLLGDAAPDRQVLVEEVAVVPVGVPLALPAVDDTQAEPYGMHLMTHSVPPLRPRR